MQKPYSLLRNNKQSGPYSLEELLHLNLKPFDLVWVEGKSGGWSYPTEIDTLKQHVAEAPKKVVAERKNEFNRYFKALSINCCTSFTIICLQWILWF